MPRIWEGQLDWFRHVWLRQHLFDTGEELQGKSIESEETFKLPTETIPIGDKKPLVGRCYIRRWTCEIKGSCSIQSSTPPSLLARAENYSKCFAVIGDNG